MALLARAKELIKKHPYMTGGLVLGVGLLLYLLAKGGGGGSASSDYAAEQEQADQLEASLAGQQAQLQAAQLQANTQLSADELSAQVQESQIGGQLDEAQIAAALQQAVTNTQVGGAVEENAQNTSAATTEAEYGLLGGLGSALLSNIKSIAQIFTGSPSTITVTGSTSGIFGSGGSNLGLSSLFGSSGSTASELPAGGTALSESFGDLPGADIGSLTGFGSDANLPSFSSLGSFSDAGDIGDIGDFA